MKLDPIKLFFDMADEWLKMHGIDPYKVPSGVGYWVYDELT